MNVPQYQMAAAQMSVVCSNSGCRNPHGRVLTPDWFTGINRSGIATTFKTCSDCRSKDSQKKRQGRLSSQVCKSRVVELEAALTSLVLENQELKKQLQPVAHAEKPQGQLAMQPHEETQTVEQFLGSMDLEDQNDQSLEDLELLFPVEIQHKRQRFEGHSMLQDDVDRCRTPGCHTATNAGVEGFTEIMFYTSMGDTKMVKKLLGLGHSAASKRQNGCTALHLACMYGRAELASILMDGTTDVNVDSLMTDELAMFTKELQPWHNLTPLHLASFKGYTDVATELLLHGAKVDPYASTVTGSHGLTTPLHIAASMGHLHLMVVLLRVGANIKATMKMPCPPKGLSSAGCYNVHRDPLQLSTGYAHNLLSSWAATSSTDRNILFQESWLYTQLPQWSHKEHHIFPSIFKRQLFALALCCNENMEPEILSMIAKSLDHHYREQLLGVGQRIDNSMMMVL